MATSPDVVHESPAEKNKKSLISTPETEGVKERVTEPRLSLKIVGPMGICRGHIAAFKVTEGGTANKTRSRW